MSIFKKKLVFRKSDQFLKHGIRLYLILQRVVRFKQEHVSKVERGRCVDTCIYDVMEKRTTMNVTPLYL